MRRLMSVDKAKEICNDRVASATKYSLPTPVGKSHNGHYYNYRTITAIYAVHAVKKSSLGSGDRYNEHFIAIRSSQ